MKKTKRVEHAQYYLDPVVLGALAMLLVYLAAGVLTSAPAATVGRPDLSGRWVLDESRSDDPRERMAAERESSQNASGRGARRGGGKRRRSGHGLATLRQHGGDQTGHGSGTSALFPTELRIEHEEPALTIVPVDGRARLIYTDARGSSVSVSGGSNQPVSIAAWDGDELVVETTTDGGRRIVERYVLDAEAAELEIRTTVQGARLAEPVAITRIFTAK